MKRASLLLLFLIASLSAFAQQTVSGTVRDAATGEGLIGAIVMVDGKVSASSDINGHYQLTLGDGTYLLSVKFIGYTADSVKIKVAGKPVTLDFNCNGRQMKEVSIVADVAIDRKTPVAFSTINEARIHEEAGSRDLTMMLNSTPGAYATEQGGGAGDSRISIRGADQRNVGVMVDGVPMNDMETGQVYWSNWDGLTDATRTMQVQRGLGASRLAIPSVGGTINILTRGIDEKQSFYVRTDFGNNYMYKMTVSFNSGEFGKGWGVTGAASRRTGNGWVSQTWDDQWAYFFKVQKRFKKHLLTFGVNGAPQQHGQRYDRMPIAVYNYDYAHKLFSKNNGDASPAYVDSLTNANLLTGGYTTLYQGERGMQYNPNWGIINYSDGEGKLNQDINFYHKPLFNLSWFWSANDKLSISSVAYCSIGYGGGTNFNSTPNRDTLTGQFLLTNAYNSNSTLIDPLYSATEHKSSKVLLASMNNHIWVGNFTSATWRVNDKLTMLFGADSRYYKGSHYRMVYDLIGGDYFIDNSDKNQPNGAGNLQYAVKRKGDKVGYYNDSYVNWYGLFAQAEYSATRWSAFVTLTGSETQYQRVDHFKKRDVVLEDGTVVPMAVGYNEVYFYNGSDHALAQNNAVLTYHGDTLVIDNPSGPNDTIVGATAYAWNSDKARTATTVKKTFPGFTLKTGANYNLTEHYNVFMNIGYMRMAPRFNTVFDNNNKEYPGSEPQIVMAAELGIGARYPHFAANFNAYYTNWKNKPPTSSPTVSIAGDPYTYDMTGLNTLLKGIELDAAWKPFKKLSFEALASFGDWTYHSSGTAYLYDANYILADSVNYSAHGVHLGDAAQTQLGGSLRWEPIPYLYIKPRYTFFARNYANFDPIVLTPVYNGSHVQVGDNRDKDSWQMPSYGLLDIFAGYELREVINKEANRQIRVGFNLSVTNVLNTFYVSDAINGANFDATSALVYMGLGRRWTVGMSFAF